MILEPGGSRSRIYKVFEVEPMKEKEEDTMVRSVFGSFEPGGSRSRIYKVFEVKPMKEKEVLWGGAGWSGGVELLSLECEVMSSGGVHNSSKDARLSEAAATIIGSNRGLYYSLKLSTIGVYITTALGKQLVLLEFVTD
ncbi:hypothetical protein Tco_1359303 [Tanacetum coccineum]